MSRITAEDQWQDPDERNFMVPQYLAEILVAELERKRDALVREGADGGRVQSLNDQIQTLTSSKFLFDNPSQADEIINRFELEPNRSEMTNSSEEQESTINE